MGFALAILGIIQFQTFVCGHGSAQIAVAFVYARNITQLRDLGVRRPTVCRAQFLRCLLQIAGIEHATAILDDALPAHRCQTRLHIVDRHPSGRDHLMQLNGGPLHSNGQRVLREFQDQPLELLHFKWFARKIRAILGNKIEQRLLVVFRNRRRNECLESCDDPRLRCGEDLFVFHGNLKVFHALGELAKLEIADADVDVKRPATVVFLPAFREELHILPQRQIILLCRQGRISPSEQCQFVPAIAGAILAWNEVHVAGCERFYRFGMFAQLCFTNSLLIPNLAGIGPAPSQVSPLHRRIQNL